MSVVPGAETGKKGITEMALKFNSIPNEGWVCGTMQKVGIDRF
jgi:hypothetical protein